MAISPHNAVAVCTLLAALTGCAKAGLPAAAAQPGASARLKAVTYNIHWNRAGGLRIIEALRPIDADIILLQEAPEADLGSIAGALRGGRGAGLHIAYGARFPTERWGQAILSRLPLERVAPICWPGREEAFGVWAETVVGGKRFAIACVHLTPTQSARPWHLLERERARREEIEVVLRLWRQRGSPPLLLGGDFNQIGAGGNYSTLRSRFTDALASIGDLSWTCNIGWLKTRVDYLWLTPDWAVLGGGVVESDASDHRPVWAVVDLAAEGKAQSRPSR